MAEAVYLLCAVTSVLCAVLLYRGYRTSRTRLLFWASVCFVLLAINNLMLFVDVVVFPEVEIPMVVFARSLVALAGLSVLIYGLISEAIR